MTRDNSREALLDPSPVTCSVGDRIDCKYFVHDSDDEVDFYCEHPDLGETEEECPLDADDEEAESHGIDMNDDMGNQDEEDE